MTFNEFIVEMMEHKEIDHNAAHLTWGNQFLHLISSIMMIYVYYLLGCCLSGWGYGGVRGDVWVIGCCYVGGECDYYMKMAALITVSAQSMRQVGIFSLKETPPQREIKNWLYNRYEEKSHLWILTFCIC